VKQRRGKTEAATKAFPLAARGELGYQIEQVESFLARARESYDDTANDAGAPQSETARVTSADIRQTAFRLGRRGYSARFVDAAMDRLEEVFYERERRERIQQIGEEAWWVEIGQLLREVRGRIERPRGKRFARRGIFASGYRRSQVDAFLDRVIALFAGKDSLTTAEVRNVVFHSEWRGYSEDQVDALLDAVIELLLATR
jgi:DivIVA domain-containing protein